MFRIALIAAALVLVAVGGGLLARRSFGGSWRGRGVDQQGEDDD